jgi:hypothetical protein
MTDRVALDMYKNSHKHDCLELMEADEVAYNALQERIDREKGCEYCNGEKTLYQHTTTTKLYMNTFGKARTLVTECIPCPPYAECCLKGNSCNSAFLINFCPECGRKLKTAMPGEE